MLFTDPGERKTIPNRSMPEQAAANTSSRLNTLHTVIPDSQWICTANQLGGARVKRLRAFPGVLDPMAPAAARRNLTRERFLLCGTSNN